MSTRSKSLAHSALGVLVFTLGVILWGAFVRASGSGAGCGSHWPLCNGEVVPAETTTKMMIEFTHRLTSGLSLLSIIILYIWVRRSYSAPSPQRKFAFLSLILILVEAAIGAALVLLKLVENDASALRAFVIGFHLVNTYALVAALTSLTFVLYKPQQKLYALTKRPARLFQIAAFLLICVGASGGIVALGDTLFPAKDLISGIKQDFSPTAHFLIRLRLWHPILAILCSAFLVFLPKWIYQHYTSEGLKRPGVIVMSLVITQLTLGFLNLYLLAPHWMQLIHLAFAEFIVISLVYFWLVTRTTATEQP